MTKKTKVNNRLFDKANIVKDEVSLAPSVLIFVKVSQVKTSCQIAKNIKIKPII